jgi:Polyketide cyclase / dehydrase and lipid transport
MSEVRSTERMGSQPEAVYELVADITRMGEWSPENTGGEWLDGATGPAVGARFKGRNKRKASWTTTAVVTEAEPGRAFAFAVGRGAPENPDTRWRYTFAALQEGGCEVTETCEIVNEPGWIGRYLTKLGTGVWWSDRPADLASGMEETLRRLKARAEAHS